MSSTNLNFFKVTLVREFLHLIPLLGKKAALRVNKTWYKVWCYFKDVTLNKTLCKVSGWFNFSFLPLLLSDLCPLGELCLVLLAV